MSENVRDTAELGEGELGRTERIPEVVNPVSDINVDGDDDIEEFDLDDIEVIESKVFG